MINKVDSVIICEFRYGRFGDGCFGRLRVVSHLALERLDQAAHVLVVCIAVLAVDPAGKAVVVDHENAR